MHILVVEDEPKIAGFLRRGLEDEGHRVDVTTDLAAARLALELTPFDLILLDRMLPDGDGLSLVRELRRRDDRTPTLCLTARDRVEERVEGLYGGADDYLVKPFSPRTLVARVRAVLRRRSPQSLDDAVQMGPLKLDPATRRVTCLTGGVPTEIRLGPTEFRLLHYLLTHPERVHSRAQLLDRVWGDHVFIEERTVDVHIKRLRESLSVADCSGMVETVRGAGYRLAALPQVVAG
jgi:two-component system phosphate regulon response regulator PhoB